MYGNGRATTARGGRHARTGTGLGTGSRRVHEPKDTRSQRTIF